ncbi:MAG TPA: chemotaxis protein CheX, partial [Vicinamibacterales bacterium]
MNQIVENVFQTMMNLEVHAEELPWPPKGELITAAISLAGTWKGAVLVECGLNEAFLFTSRMIGVDLPTSLNDDVRDALGELANMVGGN